MSSKMTFETKHDGLFKIGKSTSKERVSKNAGKTEIKSSSNAANKWFL